MPTSIHSNETWNRFVAHKEFVEAPDEDKVMFGENYFRNHIEGHKSWGTASSEKQQEMRDLYAARLKAQVQSPFDNFTQSARRSFLDLVDAAKVGNQAQRESGVTDRLSQLQGISPVTRLSLLTKNILDPVNIAKSVEAGRGRRAERSIKYPSRPGATETAGQVVGSILPSAAAVVTSIATAPFTGGSSLIGTVPLILGMFYSAYGSDLMDTAERMEQTGERISPLRQQFKAIGKGSFEAGTEYLSVALQIPIIKKASAPALERLGKVISASIKTGRPGSVKSLLGKTFGLSFVEGSEEAVNQALSNLADMLIAPDLYEDIELHSGVAQAFGLGAAGAPLILPGGILANTLISQPIARRRAHEANLTILNAHNNNNDITTPEIKKILDDALFGADTGVNTAEMATGYRTFFDQFKILKAQETEEVEGQGEAPVGNVMELPGSVQAPVQQPITSEAISEIEKLEAELAGEDAPVTTVDGELAEPTPETAEMENIKAGIRNPSDLSKLSKEAQKGLSTVPRRVTIGGRSVDFVYDNVEDNIAYIMSTGLVPDKYSVKYFSYLKDIFEVDNRGMLALLKQYSTQVGFATETFRKGGPFELPSLDEVVEVQRTEDEEQRKIVEAKQSARAITAARRKTKTTKKRVSDTRTDDVELITKHIDTINTHTRKITTHYIGALMGVGKARAARIVEVLKLQGIIDENKFSKGALDKVVGTEGQSVVEPGSPRADVPPVPLSADMLAQLEEGSNLEAVVVFLQELETAGVIEDQLLTYDEYADISSPKARAIFVNNLLVKAGRPERVSYARKLKPVTPKPTDSAVSSEDVVEPEPQIDKGVFTDMSEDDVRVIQELVSEIVALRRANKGTTVTTTRKGKSDLIQDPQQRTEILVRNLRVVLEREGADPTEIPYHINKQNRRLLEKELAKLDLRELFLKRLHSGFDPRVILDVYKIGDYHFHEGLQSFTQWTKAMIKEVGQKVNRFLKQVWNMLQSDTGAITLPDKPTKEGLDLGSTSPKVTEPKQTADQKKVDIVRDLKVRSNKSLEEHALASSKGLLSYDDYLRQFLNSKKSFKLPTWIQDELMRQHWGGQVLSENLISKLDNTKNRTPRRKAVEGDPKALLEFYSYLAKQSTSRGERELQEDWSGISKSDAVQHLEVLGLEMLDIIGLVKQAKPKTEIPKKRVLDAQRYDRPDIVRSFWINKFQLDMIPEQYLQPLIHWLSIKREESFLYHIAETKRRVALRTKAIVRLQERIDNLPVQNDFEGIPSQSFESILNMVGPYQWSPERTFSYMFGVDHPLVKELMDMMLNAERKGVQVALDAQEPLEQGLPNNWSPFLHKKTNLRSIQRLDGSTTEISPAQMVDLLLTNEDADGRYNQAQFGVVFPERTFTNQQGKLLSNPDTYNKEENTYEDSEIQHILSQASQDERYIAGLMRDGLNKMRTEVVEWSKTLPPVERDKFITEIDRIGSYWNLRKKGKGVDFATSVYQDLKSFLSSRASDMGIFAPRVKGGDVLEVKDAFATFLYVTSAVGQLVGKQRAAARLGHLFGGQSEGIDQKPTNLTTLLSRSRKGRKTQGYIRAMLENWQGLMNPKDSGDLEKFLLRLMDRAGPAILAYRASTLMMQYASVMVSSIMVPPKYILSAMTSSFSTIEERDELAKKSQLYRQRRTIPYYARMSPGVGGGFMSMMVHDSTLFNKVTSAGLKPMKLMDEDAVYRQYRAVRAWGLDIGWSDETIVKTFEEVMNRTQATSTAMTQSELARNAKRGSFISRITSLFSSDILKQVSLRSMEWQRFKESDKGEDDWRRFLWGNVIWTLVLPIWYMLARGAQGLLTKAPGAMFNKRSVDDWLSDSNPFTPEKMVWTTIQSLSSTYFGPIGRPAEDLIRGAITATVFPEAGNVPQLSNPVAQIVEGLGAGITMSIQFARNVLDDDKTKQGSPLDRLPKAIGALLKSVALATGAPVVVSDVVRNLAPKDRAYYYDMLYRSMYHSNGIRRSDTNRKLKSYALGQLRDLGVTRTAAEGSLRNRLRKARD